MYGYLAFKVPLEIKAQLAELFPHAYEDYFGDHITYTFGVPDNHGVDIESPHVITIRALYRSNEFEVFTVDMDGKSDRPDGRRYHLTWSRLGHCMKGPRYSIDSILDQNLICETSIHFVSNLEFIPMR